MRRLVHFHRNRQPHHTQYTRQPKLGERMGISYLQSCGGRGEERWSGPATRAPAKRSSRDRVISAKRNGEFKLEILNPTGRWTQLSCPTCQYASLRPAGAGASARRRGPEHPNDSATDCGPQNPGVLPARRLLPSRGLVDGLALMGPSAQTLFGGYFLAAAAAARVRRGGLGRVLATVTAMPHPPAAPPTPPAPTSVACIGGRPRDARGGS